MTQLPQSHSGFVHLRVHSAFSLAESAIKIPKLIDLCKKYRMPAAAMTDTGNLFGAMEFSLAASAAGIQPIIGCQVHLASTEVSSLHKNSQVLEPLVLLAQNELGYQNLMKIVSKAYLERSKNEDELPQIALQDIAPLNQGLIALTGGREGRLGRLIGAKEMGAAKAHLQELQTLFQGRLYIELSRYGLADERHFEEAFIALAYEHNIPLVATNEAFFPTADMYEAHDALLCITEGKYITQTDRRRLPQQHWLRSPEEMQELFADIPEAIQNTLVIAQRCSYLLTPCKPLLPAFPTTNGRTEPEEFRYQAAVGLERRLQKQVYTQDMSEAEKEEIRLNYQARLDYEIGVIESMGFPGYYLIMADVIQWAKGQGIPVGPGRGSGAGSLAAWVLTITDIDPIRFGLIFERFLNPERVSMPDFDVDFCQERRDEVISYVQSRYGFERVAHIITFSKLQARAVLRDVGRVLEMPYGYVDRICKLIPNNPANPINLSQALEMEPQITDMMDEDPVVAKLVDIGLKLEGLYRQASTHAAGVVIGDRPLNELVPLYLDVRSTIPATQFNMKYVEMAGLVKFDFLGLKTLTVLAHTAKIVEETEGMKIDFATVPLDDPLTFDLLRRVEVVGVFQLESGGMRDVLRRLQPQKFEELIALVALYRPGPMDDIPRYLACRSGEEPVNYSHPMLEDILRETFGVMVYQEQVMHIAQVLSGYTLGGADLLRRAMGKKIKSEMDDQRKIFVDGAVQNQVNASLAGQIFDQVAKFAGYGFNKSHAAPYALISYHTAYLKANFPAAFMAAAMTLDITSTDELNNYARELNRMGITLLPPDVNTSEVLFTVEKCEGQNAVRYGLAAIKNVGQGAMEQLTEERRKNGPFKSLEDFVGRISSQALNKRQLEQLISAGAFDSLHPNRRQLYEGVEMIIKSVSALSAQRASQQKSLFQDLLKPNLTLASVQDWHPLERLQFEFSALGFYLSAHPLHAYGEGLSRMGIRSYRSVEENPPQATSGGGGKGKDWQRKYPTAIVAGVLLAKQERSTKTGQKYAFLQLSDTSGAFEVAVFSEVLARSRELLILGKSLLLTVACQEGETLRLTVESLEDLDQASTRSTRGLKIHITSVCNPYQLSEILLPTPEDSKGGTVQLVLAVSEYNKVSTLIDLPGRYHISAEVRARLSTLPGVIQIKDI